MFHFSPGLTITLPAHGNRAARRAADDVTRDSSSGLLVIPFSVIVLDVLCDRA
jgi:hypothetical protein